MIAPRDAARRVRSGTGIATALAVAGAALLTGCAAGQQAQTAEVIAANDAQNGSVGNMAVRGVAVRAPSGTSYAPGSSAQLQVVFVNVSGKPDTLVSVTSPAFTGWSSAPKSAGTATPLTGPSSASASSGSASSGSASSGSSSASSPSASSPSAGSTRVPIPGASRVSYGVPDATAVLTVTGIKQRLYPGEAIRIRFSFDHAGSVTIAAPIQLTSSPGTAVIGGETSSPAGGGDAPEPPSTSPPHTPETTTTPTS